MLRTLMFNSLLGTEVAWQAPQECVITAAYGQVGQAAAAVLSTIPGFDMSQLFNDGVIPDLIFGMQSLSGGVEPSEQYLSMSFPVLAGETLYFKSTGSSGAYVFCVFAPDERVVDIDGTQFARAQ